MAGAPAWFRGRQNEADGKRAITAGDHGVLANVYGEANAHLIAAAPDMYEALKAAINGPFSCPSVMVDQMRAALKKAEGR